MKRLIFDIVGPIIDIESHEWHKQLVVLRPVAGLLRPKGIVVSKVASERYHYAGKDRQNLAGMATFQYTLSGCGMFELDGQQQRLPPGTGFCCNLADERLSYCYPKNAAEPWRFLFVSYEDTAGITAAINDRLGYVFEIDHEEVQIQRLLAYAQMPELTIELKSGAGHLFVSAIIAMLVDRPQDDQFNARQRLARRALRAIEANMAIPFNATLLARELAVSQEHLSRVCRSELGRTPYQCICQSKMQRACEHLKNTSWSVAEVALSVGCEPGSHFSRLFKHVIGVTPSAFRASASLPLRPFY